MDVDVDEGCGGEENEEAGNSDGELVSLEEETGISENSPIVIRDEEVITTEPAWKPEVTTDITVGGALRLREDGTTGEPSVMKRQPKGPRVSGAVHSLC